MHTADIYYVMYYFTT